MKKSAFIFRYIFLPILLLSAVLYNYHSSGRLDAFTITGTFIGWIGIMGLDLWTYYRKYHGKNKETQQGNW